MTIYFFDICKHFFNEPDFLNSKKYNDELYNNTIKFAINDIIKIHFEYKKKDILNTLNNWLLICDDEYKLNIFNSINEFKSLMNI